MGRRDCQVSSHREGSRRSTGETLTHSLTNYTYILVTSHMFGSCEQNISALTVTSLLPRPFHSCEHEIAEISSGNFFIYDTSIWTWSDVLIGSWWSKVTVTSMSPVYLRNAFREFHYMWQKRQNMSLYRLQEQYNHSTVQVNLRFEQSHVA